MEAVEKDQKEREAEEEGLEEEKKETGTVRVRGVVEGEKGGDLA